jgi:tRNA 5-methylaminomethyl-2-thiouridine biosynthesis bifunctional protein
MGTEKLTAIRPARLEWRGQNPVSLEYGDIYFSSQDGLAESEQVFLKGNQLAERWQHDVTHFVIAETGFGSGLNFLAACKLWFDLAGENAQLHYCAVEKHPLRSADLERILSVYAPLEELLEPLLQSYPPLVPGIHRLNLFGSRVYLTLAFMDIEKWLGTLNIRADAWFLDGFAPARNPAMWSPSVLQQIALNTREGASFATFTAAGEVRKSLQDAGFKVEKMAGFGAKREALRGRLESASERSQTDGMSKPWFAHNMAYSAYKRATVIGAGLAGAFTADSLLRRGWQVCVIDRHTQPAREASGNRAGVIFSKLSAYDGLPYRFYQQAYLYAVVHIPQILGDRQIWSRSGMLQLAFSEQEQQRQQALLEDQLWPEEWLKGLSAAEASVIAGVPLQHQALYFPQAGWVSPAEACRYLIGRYPGIELVMNSEVVTIEFNKRTRLWRAMKSSGEVLAESEVMIITTGRDALSLPQTRYLPLQGVRGQVSDIQQTARSGDLRTVLCYDGYLTPSVGWQHSLGATYDQVEDDRRISEQDNERNLQALVECEPAVYKVLCGEHGKPEVTNARVGFRCQTPDYLPVVGPVADPDFYQQAYAALSKGQLKQIFPPAKYLDGLFVNVGHGSRGITTAPISAEIIASYLNDEPQPVGEPVRTALHPGRFLIKQIIKGS